MTSGNIGREARKKVFRAIVDEIEAYYSTPEEPVILEIEYKFFQGGRYGLFEPLECNCVDLTGTTHSLGAVIAGQLRRDMALYTCTITASSHVLFVRKADWDSGKYRSISDLVDDPNAEICGGDLDNHVVKSLFGRDRQYRADCMAPAPDPNPDPNGFHDIGICIDRVKNGQSAAFLHWDPSLKLKQFKFKKIRAGIVAGTPYWIKK